MRKGALLLLLVCSSAVIRAQESNIPAVGVAVVRDGKLREVRVTGDLQKGVPAPHDTIFNVASLMKPIVTMTTLQLVAKGEWSLDEPLAKYWVDPDVAGDPRHAKLTTRHVLGHQTGFMNWRWLEKSEKLTFHWEPGTQMRYSGEGFEYLARALEKKFGKPLAQLVEENVLRPVQMRDTQMSWSARTDESRFARWHDEKGALHDKNYKITRVNAADDLLTTAEDYGRFAAWVANGAGLPDALLAEMTKPQTNAKVSMALGWEFFPDLGGGEYALLHSGSDFGVKTLVAILPKSKRALVILTNGDNGMMVYERLIVETFGDAGKEMMSRAKGGN